ncbi:MAG: DUF433 domain-containing protein [Azoarcus sp.]|jgi:uncharacterized protein (DUF433 family)|nr:DUF433 domain-containing protein [Azoarcus sp.]
MNDPIQQRLTLEPGKRGARPGIRGMRITVRDVLGGRASGTGEDDILAGHPERERDGIRASLAFVAARASRMTRFAA